VAPTEDPIVAGLKAWNRHDTETWIDAWSPDCEWLPVTVGETEGQSTAIRGHEGLRAWAVQSGEVWERFHVEINEILRRGALVLGLGRVSARGRTSGVETVTQLFLLFELNDTGKAIWGRSFLDLEEALGAAAERAVQRDPA
jgi:ketosteroid isomerase-like protein